MGQMGFRRYELVLCDAVYGVYSEDSSRATKTKS